MIETKQELLSELRAGRLKEHIKENVELKQDWAQRHGVKLSALSNKPDLPIAWLVVGVADDGKLANKTESWARQQEEIISQQINTHLDPVQACTSVTSLEVDSAWIILVTVKNPGDVVYWGSKAFLASGSTLKEMTPDELLKLRITLPGLDDYSAQPAQSRYDSGLIELFSDRVRASGHPLESDVSGEATLTKLGIQGRQVARILFGDCRFRLVRYDRRGEPVANEVFAGLYRILTEEFLEEVQGWTASESTGDPQPYPARALKEALANAVAHAAYFERDGEVLIELGAHHLTVGNLCIRESVYFANRWFSRSHKTVNSLLMEVLRIAGHVDELGRGKHLIFSESIKTGRVPPEVVIESAGRFNRWKLTLSGDTKDPIRLRLLDRTRDVYKDEQRTLIAFALVLWRDKPVSQIRNYVDGDFARQFADVLASLEGPIFYYKENDQIVLTRWAKVLLEQGQDSKGFSPAEEANLRSFAYDMQVQFHDGYITPSELRKLGRMGDTASEKTLSSKLLSRWCDQSYVSRVSRGRYQFRRKAAPDKPDLAELVRILQSKK